MGWTATAFTGLMLSAAPVDAGLTDAYQQTFTPHQEAAMDDRANLARLVEPLNAEAARLIRDPDTTVERMATPFLRDGVIFLVVYNGRFKPVGFTVGYARAGNFTVLLPVNPAGFNELVAKAGVSMETNALRLSYAVAELEATRRFDETFSVLHRFDDLRLVPSPTAEEEARSREIKQKYEHRIGLPQTSGNGPWELPIYVLSRNDLCLFTVTIEPDGTSKVSKTVLEANTPMLPNR
jgi:hypothetical protein